MAPPRKVGDYLKYLKQGGDRDRRPSRSTWNRWFNSNQVSAEKLAELGIYPSNRGRKNRQQPTNNASATTRQASFDSGVDVEDTGHVETEGCQPSSIGLQTDSQPTNLCSLSSSDEHAIEPSSNPSDINRQNSVPSCEISDKDTERSSTSESLSVTVSDGFSDSSCFDSDASDLNDTVDSDFKKNENDIKFSKHIGFEVLNRPLCAGISTTKFESLLMIFHIALRFGFSKDFLSCMMKYTNHLLGTHDAVTESSYLFQKLFMFSSNPKIHFYCPHCELYLGTSATFPEHIVCSNCEWRKPSSGYNDGFYFVTLSIRKEIETLLKRGDVKFISKTPTGDHVVSDVKDGKLYKNLMKTEGVSQDSLTICFNTDGCPIFNCGPNSLWPIQFYLNEVDPKQRFNAENILLAGLWFGKKDPFMNIFMQPFVEELENLAKSGIVWERPDGLVVESPVYALCCCTDSVARPKLQNMMLFNASFGCGYCLHPNKKIVVTVPAPDVAGSDGEPVFKDFKIQRYTVGGVHDLRSDKQFRRHMVIAERCNVEHIYGVKGKSILSTLPHYDLIYGNPIDYLHAVLLGAVRRLANLWFDSSNHGMGFYIGRKVDWVDERLKSITVVKHMRHTAPMSQRVHWKARQWKDFLLYYGLPCLVDILDEPYYMHFLQLSTAIHTLLQESMTYREIEEANAMLNQFVVKYQELYGESNMVYNTHLLTHLGRMVTRVGPLWGYSLWAFESGNGRLKKLVQGTRGVASQIGKKYLMTQTVEGLLRNNYKAADSILEFCSEIVGYKYAKYVSNICDAVLIGNGTLIEIDDEQGKVAEISEVFFKTAVVYRKAIYRGSVYLSKKLSRQTRKNDSCVRMIDGSYGIIEYIVKPTADWSTSVFCFVRKLNVGIQPCEKLPPHLKACCIDPYGDLMCVNINDIIKKCIFISCDRKYYVGEICNTYEKE